MDVNSYLAKNYPDPGCWLLVADVFAHELERPVTEFRMINSSVRAIAEEFSLGLRKNPDGFAQIAEPVEMSLVLMSRLATKKIHHCGIYVQGGVLHALPNGPVFQDMASLGDVYKTIEFWGLPA